MGCRKYFVKPWCEVPGRPCGSGLMIHFVFGLRCWVVVTLNYCPTFYHVANQPWTTFSWNTFLWGTQLTNSTWMLCTMCHFSALCVWSYPHEWGFMILMMFSIAMWSSFHRFHMTIFMKGFQLPGKTSPQHHVKLVNSCCPFQWYVSTSSTQFWGNTVFEEL